MPNPISLAAVKTIFKAIKYFDKRNDVFDKKKITNILIINTCGITRACEGRSVWM